VASATPDKLIATFAEYADACIGLNKRLCSCFEMCARGRGFKEMYSDSAINCLQPHQSELKRDQYEEIVTDRFFRDFSPAVNLPFYLTSLFGL
jgi:hypothetical protein